MKYVAALVLLIILLVGGYFILVKFSHSITPSTAQPIVNPDQASCTTGIDGNSGDNYCSNYRSTASKCRPNTPNTYPDGCTK